MSTGTQQRKGQQSAESRNRFRFRPAYLILVILMALFAFKFIQKTQEIKRLAAQETALRQENLALERDSATVKSNIALYRSPLYIEEEARAEFGFTKPGETPIQIQRVAPPVTTVHAAPPPPPTPPAATWKQWWSAFFG